MELVPGSDVFVSGLFYAGCHQVPGITGMDLLRKLVREVFTDDEILSGATCTGKREQSGILQLDCVKVAAIKGIFRYGIDLNFRF